MRASIVNVPLSLAMSVLIGCASDAKPTPDGPPAATFKGFEADEGGEIRIEYVHHPEPDGKLHDGLRVVGYLYGNPGSVGHFPLPNLMGCTDMTKKANWPASTNPVTEQTYLDPGEMIIDAGGGNAFTVTRQTTQGADFLGRTHPANKWFYRFDTSTAFDFMNKSGQNFYKLIFTGSADMPPTVINDVPWMPAAFDIMTPGPNLEPVTLTAGQPSTFTWTNPAQSPPPAYVVLSLVAFLGPGATDGLAVLCVEPNKGSITVPASFIDIVKAKYPGGGVLGRATFTHIPRELIDKNGPTGRRIDVVTTYCHATGFSFAP